MPYPIVHPTPPAAPAPTTPTRPRAFVGEWRIALQALRLAVALPRLLRRRAVRPATVLLVPGWRAPQLTMAPLRWYLRRLGHDARHWGLGRNRGRPGRDTERLIPRVEALAADQGPVALIGWSLGGVIARETARAAPAPVRQVVTYGTPVVGGPTFTVGAASWGPRRSAEISRQIEEIERAAPLRVPVTAIFSRRDTIVSWPACIDRRNPQVVHVEVGSSHIGMDLDPDAWTAIADALDRPADQQQPIDSPP